MKVELDNQQYQVYSIVLGVHPEQQEYFQATVMLYKTSGSNLIRLKSKSVFTKNATIEDIIKDTWEDNKN